MAENEYRKNESGLTDNGADVDDLTTPQPGDGAPAGGASETAGDTPATDSPQTKPATSMMQAMNKMASDDDEAPSRSTPITLYSILGGDYLGGKWFRKQVWYMLMLTAMLIVYVSNRYACQQEMIQTKMLSDTLLDRRYKALTRSSQLKERTRRSYIEESLADSTIQTAVTPSYKMKVSE